MTENKDLSSLQYKLEWEDHLYEFYGDFARRNNKDEWLYFLRRPELAKKDETEKIAEAILRYVTKYRNISQEILLTLEDIFHFTADREKYESIIGFEAVEFYVNHLLKNKEFPPFDLFDGFDQDADYDEYVYLFNHIYYKYDISPEEYKELNGELRKTGLTHPYEALLESDYFFSCGALNEAAGSLKDMPNGYHKYMALGSICAHMQEFERAEEYLKEAVKLRKYNLDGQLIGDLIMCKWHNNKADEALDYIEGFISAGYGHIVLPIKKNLLSEIAKALMEKGKNTELSEKELLLIKDCHKIFEDYNSVIKLSEISWHNGFSDESWTVDIAEAYFEAGEYGNAEKIIEMVLDGRRPLSTKGQLQIRELRARMLFETGRIKESYEIMDTVCGHPESESKYKYHLAKMYMTTGNFKGALKLLRELSYYQSNNIRYKHDMAICFVKEDDLASAVYLFNEVCFAEPENKEAAKGFIQLAIDDDNENSLRNAKGLLDEFGELLTEDEQKYFWGQIFEMEDKCKDAQRCYESIIRQYEEGISDQYLLNDALLRYFIMREENKARVDEMESEILSMLDQYPKCDNLWTYLADFYEETDYKTEMRGECYRKALEANRFNSEARMLLASIYVENDETDKAVELYNDMILYTNDKDAYLMRAYLMADIGEYEQAQADISKYEKLGGDKDAALELNINMAMLNGEYEYALDALESFNKMNKGKKAPLYDDLAICLCKMGRADEAESLMDVACESTTNPVFFKVLYDIQVYNGNYKAAKKTLKRYRKAFDIGRTDEWIGLLSAYADLQSGKGQMAYMTSMSMIEPEGERFNGILEMLYGKPKAAIKLLKSALKNEPDELDNYTWLSFIYYLSGDHSAAAGIAEEGLELFSNTYGGTEKYLRCEALCQYGFLKMMCGELDEALEIFHRAADQPTCPEFVCRRCYEAHAGAGICHAIKGETLQANRAFDEALKENPDNTICKAIRDLLRKKE